MKTINYFSMLLMAVVVSFCMTACGGGDSDDNAPDGDNRPITPNNGGGGGGGSDQQVSIVGEWGSVWDSDTGAQTTAITTNSIVVVSNFMAEGLGTVTKYWYNEDKGWQYFTCIILNYTVSGNQGNFTIDNGGQSTCPYSITTTDSGSFLTMSYQGHSWISTKMTSKLRTQIQTLNVTPYGTGGGTASMTGEWYMHFQSSKGEGYSILSFNSDGSGGYTEYDNSCGILETTSEAFYYRYYILDGKLTIDWSKGGTKNIEVTSYTSTELVLKGWPDKGSNKFLPLTSEVEQQIEDFKEANKPVQKVYIYGEDPALEPPFVPGAYDAAAMRFNSTEGAHFPTLPDEVYFGLKTLIFDVSDVTPDFDLRVTNAWWSPTYYDHVKWVNGLNEVKITATMATECAQGGEAKDLDFILYSGSCTIKSVYYEE